MSSSAFKKSTKEQAKKSEYELASPNKEETVTLVGD
jgi:hypothetical protein